MKAREFTSNSETKDRFVRMFRKFLPLAMHYIKIKRLPRIVFQGSIDDEYQPTFGRYVNNEHVLYVVLSNRHPVDILRTVAHELQHYKQDTEHQLDQDSGRTGSPEENEAHAVAGIVMRHFNKQYPEYLNDKPVIRESAGDRGDISTGPAPQLIPFPKGTTMIDVSDVYDWYKLGMVISDLDDADPKIFGKGAPHTVIAFGSEEEEHKLLPLLKRLGLKVHDIDRPEDVKQVIPAKMLAKDLAERLQREQAGQDVENTVAEGISWSSLDRGMSVENKMEIFEEYYTKGSLRESIDEDKKDYFASLVDMSETPMKNQRYIVVPLSLVNNRIIPLDKPSYMKFLGKNQNQLIFQSPNGNVKYPSDTMRDLSMFSTFTFSTEGEYNKFRSALAIKFDTTLPSITLLDKDVDENFADGRNPQDKGDSARHGIKKGISLARLDKIGHGSGRKAQLARWQANMRRGRNK